MSNAMTEPMEAILEPALIPERYRLAAYDVELTSGHGLEVLDPTTGEWVRGSVEFSHAPRGYYFTQPVGGASLMLSEVASRRLLVRAWR